MIKNSVLIFVILLFSSAGYSQEFELKKITFEGNKEISSGDLQSIILSEESPGWFYKFLNSFTPLGAPAVYFDSSSIPIDLDALQSYYNANGFFKAKFGYKYEIDTSNNSTSLIYLIEENEPSTYGNLNIHGLEPVPDLVKEYVYKAMFLDQRNRYNQEFIQTKTDEVMHIFLSQGFVFAAYDSTIVFKDTIQNKADVSVYFTTGKQYVIDSVLVQLDGEGAKYVDKKLIHEMTALDAGDIYNLEKLRRRQLRLYRTGLFNTITVSAVETDTSNNRIPLLVSGNVGLMNELSPEIIMNNQQSAFNIGLGATYIRKNFLGDARKLTLSSSFGIQDIFKIDFGGLIKRFSFRDTTLLGYFDARVILEQPFRHRRPIDATLENYVTIEKQPNFNITRYGTKLSLDFEQSTYAFFNFLRTSYNLEVSNEFYRTLNDSVSKKLISVIGGEFGSVTVDDLLFPTRGYNLSFQLEEANALPYILSKAASTDFDGALFYKAVATYSKFGSFGKVRNYIFAGKIKVGYMQAYIGDYGGIPLNRTFYAGGSNSIRGWRSNELVPQGTPRVSGLFTNGVNVKGGTFLLEGSLESRLRFFPSFGTAVFLDFGNTWLGYRDFRFDEVAVAAGLGLRYYSPFAPFRLDFGFKLYDPADKQYIFKKNFWDNLEFHFGIGEAF